MAGVRLRAASSLQPILLGAGFLLLVSLSAATTWLVQRSAEESLRVAHTLKVQDRLSGLLLELRRMEASQRGYLFSGNVDYLEDYRSAVQDLAPKLEELREMTSDNPARGRDLEIMSALTDIKLAEMQRAITFNDAGRRDDARALVRSGDGRAMMNALRDQVKTAIADEGRLLDLRSKASQQTNTGAAAQHFIGRGAHHHPWAGCLFSLHNARSGNAKPRSWSFPRPTRTSNGSSNTARLT